MPYNCLGYQQLAFINEMDHNIITNNKTNEDMMESVMSKNLRMRS